MKKFCLFTVFFVFIAGLNGQAISDSGNHGLMSITTKKSTSDKIDGSPYLKDEFTPGIAEIEGKEPLDVLIRYNVSAEQMELKLEPQSEEVYVLPFGQNASYKLAEDVYLFDQIQVEEDFITGYFAEYFKGNNYRLLGKHKVNIIPGSSAKNGYERDKPALMKIEEDLYIVDKDGKAWEVKTRNRTLRKTFRTKEVKKYLSDNKVRSKEDLAKFVAFLDSQK